MFPDFGNETGETFYNRTHEVVGHPALPQDRNMCIYGDIEASCQLKSFNFLSKSRHKG